MSESKVVDISELFYPLWTTEKRYILITGGRGSLKSTSVHNFIMRLTYETGHGILFTRYTMTSAEKSIIPEFKIILERAGVTSHFDITRNKITNKKTGSFILFSGIKTSSGDQTANLKSISGITTWVVEEGEDFNDEKAFDTIDDSIRTTSKQNRVIWIQNPSTKEHFIYKRFFERTQTKRNCEGYNVTVSSHPDVEHIHTTYHIAEEWLSIDWLRKAERIKKERPDFYYHNYIGGWLEKKAGVIYERWIEGEFDTSLPYVFAQDIGSNDPTTLMKIAVDVKRKFIYCDEYFCQSGLNTDEIADLNKKHMDRNDIVVVDAESDRLIKDLRNRAIRAVKVKKFKGSVLWGIQRIQSFTLVVTPRSKQTKIDLNNYAWNEKKIDTPLHDYSHCPDTIRYGFQTLVLAKGGGNYSAQSI